MRTRTRTFTPPTPQTGQTADERRRGVRESNRARRGTLPENYLPHCVEDRTGPAYTPLDSRTVVSSGMTTSEAMRWYRYGLSPAGYNAMLNEQAGACAVCRQVKKLHVDHCHRTKRVRGLLCSACNTSLGQFKEDPEVLHRAIAYLKRE